MLNWVRQDKPRMNPWSQGISLARMKQKAATNCWFCGLGSVKKCIRYDIVLRALVTNMLLKVLIIIRKRPIGWLSCDVNVTAVIAQSEVASKKRGPPIKEREEGSIRARSDLDQRSPPLLTAHILCHLFDWLSLLLPHVILIVVVSNTKTY